MEEIIAALIAKAQEIHIKHQIENAVKQSSIGSTTKALNQADIQLGDISELASDIFLLIKNLYENKTSDFNDYKKAVSSALQNYDKEFPDTEQISEVIAYAVLSNLDRQYAISLLNGSQIKELQEKNCTYLKTLELTSTENKTKLEDIQHSIESLKIELGNFHGKKIPENFINSVQIEHSDIGKLIEQMVNLKKTGTRKFHKPSKPYTITDKIERNKILGNLASRIEHYHSSMFDTIESSLEIMEKTDASIRSDLFDYYWETYMDVLDEKQISNEDEATIISQSNEIYKSIENLIYKQLFENRTSSIEENKQQTYLHAITVYVFYNCKILLRM